MNIAVGMLEKFDYTKIIIYFFQDLRINLNYSDPQDAELVQGAFNHAFQGVRILSIQAIEQLRY